MIKFTAMNRKVSINLEPGLYDFASASATGKTFLVKMIKSINDSKKIAITYSDILLGISLEKIMERSPELLVLDRFDMYDSESDFLKNFKNNSCVVIVDYKTQRNFCEFDDTCFVTLKENEVEVSL